MICLENTVHNHRVYTIKQPSRKSQLDGLRQLTNLRMCGMKVVRVAFIAMKMSPGAVPRNIVLCLGVLSCILSQVQTQEIRLVGGSTQYEGRVEVRFNNQWGTVCIDDFENIEAVVICRQLQFSGGVAVTDGRFGPGTGQIWLDNLACDGTEETLSQCQANNLGVHNCDHTNDAGVRCDNPSAVTPAPTTTRAPPTAQPSNCSTNSNSNIRIIGPSDKTGVGFVEVKYNNTWGSVCDDHWDILDARVVCGALCFNQSLALAGASQAIDYVKSNVSSNFFLDDVACDGTETDLFSCGHSGVGVHNCLSGEYASVTCVPINHTGAEAPQPLLSCIDEKFTASFSRDYDPYLEHRHLTIYTPSDPCNVQYQNNSAYIIMKIPFTDCGSILTTNQTHIFYTNTIHYNFTTRLGSITRKNSYLVEVQCAFPRNQSNDNGGYSPVTQLVTQSAPGKFSVGMTIYGDDNFNEPLTVNPELTLNQPLSVSLALNASLPRLKLVMKTCFATPSGSWTDQVNHFLFENSCPNDTTVALVPWNDTVAGFRFRVFRFIGFGNVYLHCTSTVCEVDEKNEICDRSCGGTTPTPATGRRRRSARQSQRRKRSNEDHTMFYVTSSKMTVKNVKEESVIERFTQEVSSTTRTVYTTPTPTRGSPVSTSVPTTKQSSSSVKVQITSDIPTTAEGQVKVTPTTDGSPLTKGPATTNPDLGGQGGQEPLEKLDEASLTDGVLSEELQDLSPSSASHMMVSLVLVVSTVALMTRNWIV
ncbi:deleted in malignant brain tumors 1 protein-like [Pecten maximus]|uniref:deleted in malignant brain tumors 1 protein-like n=1 Tax=Pecten maximus TaxID=6579 RepID=UPI001458DE96|nr:deleted in malignant brain tumors 1 protein-like [Pecten maximus]